MSSLLERLRKALAPLYEVERELASGGMGSVFLARDPNLDRPVAIKILQPDLASDTASERFLREARILARLSHPNVVPVFQAGEAEGLSYYVMEYVEGATLKERLERGVMPKHETLKLGNDLLSALEEAHKHGIVHRDVKPGNIFLVGDRALLGDFGIAKRTTESATGLTAPGRGIGTPDYMPPEQIAGAATPRTDLYAVGMVMYEALTGRRWSIAVTTTEVDWSGVAPELLQVLKRALVWSPEERWSSAAAFRQALLSEANPAAARAPGGLKSLLGRFRRGRDAAPIGASPIQLGMPVKSIAVLPFANMSPDAEAEYFSDGITEEIINALGQLPDLRVAARTSCFAFKGSSPHLAEVREKLKVGVVLHGSVRKEGDRLRLTAQLVNAADGFHLWSERYDRELTDVFALQDELTDTIVTQLRAHLGLSGTLPKRARAENLAAYDLYLRGKFHANQLSHDGYQKAVDSYEQATEADPEYAAAYAALAGAHAWFGHIEGGKPSEIYPRGRTAALKALELDDSLAEAHSALGYIRFAYDWDWAGAEDEFKRAIALNPNSAAAHHQYSVYLGNLGRLEEAIAESERSVRLDPLWVQASQTFGYWFVAAQQYDEGRIHLERALDRDPNFALARVCLAVLYFKTQMPEKAIEECERAVSASGGAAFPQSMLGFTYGVAHRIEEARSVLATLENLAQSQYVSAAFIAFIYIGLGEHDEAFRWLERGFEERASALTWLPQWPVCDPLREDPRFIRLLQRMGLEGKRLA